MPASLAVPVSATAVTSPVGPAERDRRRDGVDDEGRRAVPTCSCRRPGARPPVAAVGERRRELGAERLAAHQRVDGLAVAARPGDGHGDGCAGRPTRSRAMPSIAVCGSLVTGPGAGDLQLRADAGRRRT